MKTSESLSELIPDLIKFQAEMPILKKDSSVSMELKSGRKVEYDYIELGSIVEQSKEVLAKHNLSIIQPRGTIEGKPALFTMLLHKSGQYIQTYTILELTGKTEQEKGSVITYNSRYDYVGMVRFGLLGEDDDGASASGNKSTAKPNLKRQEQIKTIEEGLAFLKKDRTKYIEHLCETYQSVKDIPDLNDANLTKATVAINQWVNKAKKAPNENLAANQQSIIKV
jgi:hypothetical protein